MIRLQLNLNDTPVGRYEFQPGGSVTIGRQPSCELHIQDLGVSREHCRLNHAAGRGWLVEDLGSSNGTYLNRRRIGEPKVLHDDDVITVGKFSLVVTTGQKRAREREAIGWRISPEAAERNAERKAHLAPANDDDPPILIQQDATLIGSAPRCDVQVPGLPLLAVIIRGYGGFQLLNVPEDGAAVQVNDAACPARRWLKDEDQLKLGEVSYTFHAGLPIATDSMQTIVGMTYNPADFKALKDEEES